MSSRNVSHIYEDRYKYCSERWARVQTEDFAERVRVNQAKLTSELRPHYDFIICGSGSSGSVVARRVAENPDVSVLLLEAGGSDDVPSIMEAGQWPANLGSDRDWAFQAHPNPNLNGRSIPMNMGKVLGGGSSINVMAWSRGHKNDWDYFASEAGDPAWSYESLRRKVPASGRFSLSGNSSMGNSNCPKRPVSPHLRSNGSILCF